MVANKWLEKDFIASNLAVAAALGCFYFFPIQNNVVQQLLVSWGFFIVFPLLFIRFILKQANNDFGFCWGDIRAGILWAISIEIVFGGSVVLLFGLSHPVIQASILLVIRRSFPIFLLYIASSWLILACIEALFRGLLLFAWEKTIGGWAVFLQAGVFCLWLFLRLREGIPIGGWVFILIWSLCAGWVAQRSRSLFFSFLFSGFSAILLIVAALVFSR